MIAKDINSLTQLDSCLFSILDTINVSENSLFAPSTSVAINKLSVLYIFYTKEMLYIILEIFNTNLKAQSTRRKLFSDIATN